MIPLHLPAIFPALPTSYLSVIHDTLKAWGEDENNPAHLRPDALQGAALCKAEIDRRKKETRK